MSAFPRTAPRSEGFASYVESYVSENIGGYDAHVFRDGNADGPRRCARGGRPGRL